MILCIYFSSASDLLLAIPTRGWAERLMVAKESGCIQERTGSRFLLRNLATSRKSLSDAAAGTARYLKSKTFLTNCWVFGTESNNFQFSTLKKQIWCCLKVFLEILLKKNANKNQRCKFKVGLFWVFSAHTKWVGASNIWFLTNKTCVNCRIGVYAIFNTSSILKPYFFSNTKLFHFWSEKQLHIWRQQLQIKCTLLTYKSKFFPLLISY